MNNSYQNKPFYPENFNERISNNAHKPSQNLFNCLIPNFSNTQENLLSLLNNIKGNPLSLLSNMNIEHINNENLIEILTKSLNSGNKTIQTKEKKIENEDIEEL